MAEHTVAGQMVDDRELEKVDQMLQELSPDRQLTVDEIREQRISFAYGMMGSKSTMTREQVEKILRERYG